MSTYKSFFRTLYRIESANIGQPFYIRNKEVYAMEKNTFVVLLKTCGFNGFINENEYDDIGFVK